MMDYNQAEYLADTYADLILRLSYTYLKNTHDAQDICQTVFVRLLTHPMQFDSPAYEKAYIIRMTINACKDILKSPWRKKTCGLDVVADIPAPEPNEHSLLYFVQNLPVRYRTVIYLYYYEEYSAQEIGQLLGISTAAVHTRLSRGRTLLKKQLGGDDYAQRIQ